MANQTDKFNTTTFITNNAPPVVNWNKGGFNVSDADGKVISNVPLDSNRQAKYSRTLTGDMIGQQSIRATFTGDQTAAHGSQDGFTSVLGGSSASAYPGVLRIVAGPGIYISAPNGQGVVTISTSPINPNPVTTDLYEVTWSKRTIHPVDPANLGEFIAVGLNGVSTRSRDGVNWTQLPTVGGVSVLNGVYAHLDGLISNGQLEYAAVAYPSVGTQNQITFGIQGDGVDGFTNGTYNLIDQTSSPIVGCNLCYVFPTSVGQTYLYAGAAGQIWSGAVVVSGSDGQIYAETAVDTSKQINQLAASNTTTTNTFKAIAPYYNFDNGTGQIQPGGGVFVSSRTGNSHGTWSTAYTDASVSYFSASYGDGHYVVGGTGNTVLWSTDAVTWHKVKGAIPGAIWWYGAYGNGRHVMVGYKTVNGQDIGVVQYSTDGGATWTAGNSGTSKRLYSITYSPDLNIFVAVGSGGSIVSVKG
jgi:hypothetical protein